MKFYSRAPTAAIFYFLVLISALSHSSPVPEIDENDVKYHQLVNATPVALAESGPSKGVVRCARVTVPGLSRLKLRSYSSAHKITLVPSEKILEIAYKNIQICLHKNSSLEHCQCTNDSWESIQGGMWSSTISPYEQRYVDVMFVNNLSGSVTVTVNSEFHRWRLICLAVGLVLLLLAPIVSTWVPFYYSSSMAIGICLVVIIVLFQGMKLLPTGRKSALYSTICGLALGAGSFLLNRLSAFVNSVLVNFGISEEMQNPVLVFLLVGIVLAGAAFGYWFVRKFVVASDGGVDVYVAQFVKWALRVIAVAFILQSTLDIPLVVALLVSLLGIYYSLAALGRHGLEQALWFSDLNYHGYGSPPMRSSVRISKNKRTEFLSRSGTTKSEATLWRNSKSSPGWSRSPVEGTPYSRNLWRNPVSSPAWSSAPVQAPHTDICSVFFNLARLFFKLIGIVTRDTPNDQDFYSTIHKVPHRKRFSEEEWRDFTEQSTRQAVAELTSSPEFTDWVIEHADRIQIRPEESSDEGSGSDSTSEHISQSSSGRKLFWSRHT